MGSCGGNLNTINFNAWLQTAWGAGQEYWSAGYASWYGAATNLVFGTNPPYYLDDFKCVYPKFFGPATPVSNCSVANASNVITVPNVAGFDYGQFVQAFGVFPKGTVVVGIGNGTVTVNNNSLAASTSFALMAYQAAPIPVGVVLMYLNLACASLVQRRWQEQWYVALGWFIAHYLTLYAKSDASEVFQVLQTVIHGEIPVGVIPGTIYALSAQPPGGVLQALTKNGLFQTPGIDYVLNGITITMTAATVDGDDLYVTWPTQFSTLTPATLNGAQIAAQGLAGGIQTSKSVGDVSVGYQPLTSLEDWGQWNLTTYGQQLATMARVVGTGPMCFW